MATSTRALPRLKLSSAFWRAFCDLLPWIASERDATILERLGDAVGAALGAGEDDDPLERRVGQQVAQQRALGGGVHEVDALVDLLDGAALALRRDLDPLGVLQDLRRELGDVARHGGGEQQRLALLGDRADDAAHVADEAHVEHAVGLVEDEEGHVAELHVAALDQVEQAARRGDQDVDAARQGLDLAAIAQAADDGAEAQAEAAAVGVEAAGDLDRELAGRRQHERARALGLGALLDAERCCSTGSAKAAVLPVPVWAMPSTSRPCSSAGMVRAWMGVGTVYLAASRARSSGSARPRSANETLLTGNKVLLAADRAFRARVCRAAFGPFPRAAGTALFLGIVSG